MNAFDTIQKILDSKEHKSVDFLSPYNRNRTLFGKLHFYEPVFNTRGLFRMVLFAPSNDPKNDINTHYELIGNLGWNIRHFSSHTSDGFIIVDKKHLLLAQVLDSATQNVVYTLGNDRALADCILHFENLWKTAPFRALSELFTIEEVNVLYDSLVQTANSKTATEIATLSSEVWDELIQYLIQDSRRLYSLAPRKFEELIAELLIRDGFDVHLTPATRDGGYDIMAALQTRLGKLIYFVECKRYSLSRPVGVGIVRSLYGTVKAESAHAGVIITTSNFTGPSLDFATQQKNLMNLIDYKQLKDWLKTSI